MTSRKKLDIITDKSWRKEVSKFLNFNQGKRFLSCGQVHLSYKCPDHDYTKKVKFSCDLRICPDCSRKQSLELYHQLKERIISLKLQQTKYRRFKHIILTIPVTRKPFQDIYIHIKKAEKQIQRVREFLWKINKKSEWGSITALEVGYKNGMIHYHIFYWGKYINGNSLLNAWKLGFIKIKNIESKTHLKKALWNVVLYTIQFVSKKDILLPANIAGIINFSLKRIRRIKTWGIFYRRLSKKTLYLICETCGLPLKFQGIEIDAKILSFKKFWSQFRDSG